MAARGMLHLMRPSAAAGLLLLLPVAAGHPQSRSLGDCEAAYPPPWGHTGKNVPWVPTSDAVAVAMLETAKVTPHDLVLDLGAGDGRIAIAAAKSPFGARAVGIEFDPYLVKRAACLIRAEGLVDRVRVIEGDIFDADFGAPSVVTLYLLPEINLCVRHRLLEMQPGTRIVSHQYAMADWEPDESVKVMTRDVYLWVVPARVDGIWEFRDSQGTMLTFDLRQVFAAISGQIERSGARTNLLSASLRGVELRFTFDEAGATTKFLGTVRGDEITGVFSTGLTARTATGRLRGRTRGAPWAEMPPSCRRYYQK